MNPEEKKLLEQTFLMTKENNAILHSQRRWAFIWGAAKIAIYAVIIGFPIYYFVNTMLPMINTGVSKLNEVQSAIGKVQGATQNVGGQFSDLNKIINQFKDKIPTGN